MNSKKKGSNRGCIFGALGIIIVVLALFVIIGSCSDQGVNEELQAIENQVETDTVSENTDEQTATAVGLTEYKIAVEDFYQEIMSYMNNPDKVSADAMSEKINNTEEAIMTFISYPLKDDVPKEDHKVINELRSLLDNELGTCGILSNYYQTEDQSYLAAAKANLDSIKKELDKINEETND